MITSEIIVRFLYWWLIISYYFIYTINYNKLDNSNKPNKSNKLFRTISSDSKEKNYDDIIKDNDNCHLGQRKLLFAEIEFLNYVSKYISLSDALILYVGASPGSHINILKYLFPDTNYLLYDSLPFDIKFTDNVKKVRSLFSDETCKDVINYKKEINKKYLVYITDIRTREHYQDEIAIWNDMKCQERWGILLDADFMSIKFRLPWIDDIRLNTDYKSNYDDLQDKLIFDYDNATPTQNHITYLKGKIFIQIYALKRSSEARLFVRKRNGKYKIVSYDCIKYERQMNYFNIITKDEKFTFKKSKKVENELLYFNDSYDSVSEYHIIYKYVKTYLKLKQSKYHNKIVEVLYNISFKWHVHLNNHFVIYCPFYVYFDFIKKIDEHIKLKQKNKLKKELDKLNKYIEIFKLYEINLNIAYQKVKSNHTISKNDFDLMIKKLVNTKIFYQDDTLISFNHELDQFIVDKQIIKQINNTLIKRIKEQKITNWTNYAYKLYMHILDDMILLICKILPLFLINRSFYHLFHILNSYKYNPLF